MRQYGDERWGKRTGVKSGVSAERGETCGRAWRVAVAFARALGSGVCGLEQGWCEIGFYVCVWSGVAEGRGGKRLTLGTYYSASMPAKRRECA